jgi:hypothetical protein
MKKLLKEHIERLNKERASLENYLESHLAESKTTVYAGVQLGLAWCKVKIAFWSAVLNEQAG